MVGRGKRNPRCRQRLTGPGFVMERNLRLPENPLGLVVLCPFTLVDYPDWQNHGTEAAVFARIARTDLTLWRERTC